jgi:signal transduction histidine kinase
LVGIINLESPREGAFSEPDQRLLEGLTILADLAIHNARQYHELEQTKDFLFTSRSIARMGLAGVDERHTIHQKTFSLEANMKAMRLLLEKSNPSNQAAQLMQALNQCDELLETIRSMLAPKVVQPGGAEENHVYTIIDDELRDHVRRWHNEHKDAITLELALHCAGVYVKIPPKLLILAIEKLVNNALKAMPDGGRLTVSTKHQSGVVQIRIEDTGPGIPESVRPYFLKNAVPRTKKDGGTGTGVLLALYVAQDQGGNLSWADANPGPGTVMTMTLPALVGKLDIKLPKDTS